jgi:hypothetical protein
MKQQRLAELGYSKERGTIELVLPYGTKLEELSTKYRDVIFRDALSKLPRGCPACTSGDNFIIRERLENVIQVDLESGEILGP